MNYKNIIESAISRGASSEDAMWRSVASVENLLEEVKEEYHNLYWRFMRNAHAELNGRHYTEDFAEYDVNTLVYVDEDGQECNGPHWTKQQVVDATKRESFKPDVTDCDKYVAYNVMFSDLCRGFDDEQIMKAAHMFFFEDQDWQEDGKCTKIWDYMCMHNKINAEE